MYNKLSDVELTSLLKEGDAAAFTEIYNRYKRLLYIYACKIVKDDDLAEDIVQELFVYLWDKRENAVPKNSLSSYLYSAVRYKFFDLLDRKKVREDYVQAFQLFLDQGEYLTDNYIDEKDLAQTIESEIDRLPEKTKQIFLLRRNEDLSNAEIAEQLDLSEKTVRNQMSLALKTLKEKLGLFAFLYFLLNN